MSYHWKKNNLRVVINPDLTKERSEVLDLSDNRLIDKYEDQISVTSSLTPDLMIVNTHDNDEDDSRNGDFDRNDSEQNRPGKRNPKCARCANHVREPVAVKGHKRKCPYKDCVCRLCNLTVERRELMAKTIREKRKQKEDLADNSYVYNEPVFKKHRTDESSSETDRESGYGTEENEKFKQNEHEFDDELKRHIDKIVPIIWGQLLDKKLTLSEIGQTLLALYLKDNMSSMIKHNSTPNSITNRIIDASKQLTFNGLTVISPMGPIPFTPLTPTTPSRLLSPVVSSPSSASSSTGSADSPNESLKADANLLHRNYFPLLPHIYPYIPPYGPKNQWLFNPMAPVHNHTSLAGL